MIEAVDRLTAADRPLRSGEVTMTIAVLLTILVGIIVCLGQLESGRKTRP